MVHTLADCADFSKTVAPFIPQLRSFSLQLVGAWADPQLMKDLYLLTNPLISAFAFSLFLFPIFLLVSEVNRNYSQVDRMWSILPAVYNAHYALWAYLQGPFDIQLLEERRVLKGFGGLSLQAKKGYLKTAKVPTGFEQEDLDRGFVVTGLWSWSRHPNFAAEQVGALSYIILFQASTWFTESISSEKYPEYAEYQRRVGMFLPKLGTSAPGNFTGQTKEDVVKSMADVAKDPIKEKS
ncbi:hypothetical protein FGG08_002759 [Glutinoglossum americanum]|uniref:DUF1295-domain-containing protein n=1 Tax=Glutinoglossum americanum TaxID=1670608 RepID=A0A9P8ICC5_9PEZI|nr:hypothetical protein FGG08_002759 [Glutinoglossum americanum]